MGLRGFRAVLRLIVPVLLVIFGTVGCNLEENAGNSPDTAQGDLYTVVNIVDGDTIDVRQGDVTYVVRYIGINTPERNEVCYADAKQANTDLVSGQMVRMERDRSNTDRYGRLLRYVYAGDIFINERLVADGYAEAVLYEPDDRFFDRFSEIEGQAAQAGLGCHPTGIFNDGSVTR